jgi:hypothetical protein
MSGGFLQAIISVCVKNEDLSVLFSEGKIEFLRRNLAALLPVIGQREKLSKLRQALLGKRKGTGDEVCALSSILLCVLFTSTSGGDGDKPVRGSRCKHLHKGLRRGRRLESHQRTREWGR